MFNTTSSPLQTTPPQPARSHSSSQLSPPTVSTHVNSFPYPPLALTSTQNDTALLLLLPPRPLLSPRLPRPRTHPPATHKKHQTSSTSASRPTSPSSTAPSATPGSTPSTSHPPMSISCADSTSPLSRAPASYSRPSLHSSAPLLAPRSLKLPTRLPPLPAAGHWRGTWAICLPGHSADALP